jgi:glycosyltransferase involved in cell wall biosynthesis
LADDNIKNKRSPKVTRFIVAHLLNDFSGSPRVLADFCNAERIQSQRISIITSGSDGFLDDKLGEKLSIWYPRGRLRFLNYLSFAFAQLQLFVTTAALILRGWVKRERIIVVNNTILSLGSMLASKCFAATNITYVHELNSGPAIVRRFAQLLIQWTADHVIFVSKFVSDDYNLSQKSTIVLPNGLRTDFEQAINLDYSLKFSQKQILFVGSLKHYKGIHELVKIARELPETPFLGIFNTTEQMLQEFGQAEKIPSNLTVIPHQYNLQNLYRESFLVMNLSLPDTWIESFALTILEGMASGCPCVAPPIGGHLTYFDSNSGLIADARNTSEIVGFIQQLQDDEKLWRRYSDHAVEVATHYSAEQYAKRVNEMLDGY